MKRAFVRALWGTFLDINDSTNPRPSKTLDDIKAQVDPKYKHPFVVYTFGRKNHDYLISMGFDSKLVSEAYQLWDMKTELYRHKLEVFKYAMQDYDEIVYLDWDCVAIQPIVEDFWDRLGKRESFQANLFQYLTKKCLWRREDQRKVCNGGFVYMRDKSIPDQLIKNWDGFKEWSIIQKQKRLAKGSDLRFREKCLTFDDEPAMSKYVDDVSGGWKGSADYFYKFEPNVCVLGRKSVYAGGCDDEYKTPYFRHML